MVRGTREIPWALGDPQERRRRILYGVRRQHRGSVRGPVKQHWDEKFAAMGFARLEEEEMSLG